MDNTSYKHSAQIKSQYGLTGPLTSNLVHDGPDNEVFIITDAKDNKYALRASKRIEKNISFEIEVLVFLAEEGFSSPQPLRTLSGEYSITLNNSQLVLFTYIEGSQIEKLKPEHLKSNVIECGARKLGELHLLTNGLKVKAIPTRTLFTEYERLLTLEPQTLKQFNNYEALIEQAKKFQAEALSRIEKKQDLSGVIHNDYRVQNLIYTDNNCFIIDFDWSCYAPLLKDLGLAIVEWSFYDQSNGPAKEVIKRFLKAYNETAPQLVKYDKNLIFWICFACLSDSATFLVDVTQGKHANKNITDINQCYMYNKFKHFYQELK